MKRSSKGYPRGIDRPRGQTYRARVFWEGRQVSIGHFHTLGDAKAALAIARSEVARQTFVPPKERRRLAAAVVEQEARQSLTVRQWCETWLDGLKVAERSPGTITSYRSTLKVHILPVLGDRRLVDVTTSDIDELLADMREAKGPWANVARTVRAMFAAAAAPRVQAGGLTESPVVVSVPKPKRVRKLAPDEIPTAEQAAALRGAMPPELAVAVDLAAWCAMRLGEVLGLQRRDLENLDDPKRAMLHVRRQWHTKSNPPAYGDPKRGSARSISIPPRVAARLAEHMKEHAGSGLEGPVLPSPRDPVRPISEQAFNTAWNAARKVAGVKFVFHDLRHLGLSLYAQQGATLAEIMARGGHTNVDAAMIYQMSSADRDRELAARLDSIGESA